MLVFVWMYPIKKNILCIHIGFFHKKNVSLKISGPGRWSSPPTPRAGPGSRLGVEKGALLDWNDYYFLSYHANCQTKWPDYPPYIR
ncbi:hypothetical protein Hdeb2414_s0560g00916951 [Helianthus debilis subsp. tardiflorus]